MTSPQASPDDPAERIRRILMDLMVTAENSVTEIHQIVKQEVQRLGEDTPEGRSWLHFGGEKHFTDVGRASRNIQSEIAAIRGNLVYRLLDSNQKDYVPLNQQRANPDPEKE